MSSVIENNGHLQREFALKYLGFGWSVVPLHVPTVNGCSCGEEECENAGKHPRVPWASYQHQRPSEGQVRKWWKKWPTANVGVITGKISGLVVIDLDGPEAVSFAREQGVPLTPCARTGKGWHLYFRHPGFAVPNAVRLKEFGDGGIDVRGDGGLVVAPPSLHPSGRRYEWAKGRAPWEVPLANLPGWLLELLRTDSNQAAAQQLAVNQADDWVLTLLQGVPEGQRNDAATRLLGHWLGKGLSEAEVWFLLCEWNQRNQPPLPERELAQVFKSILGREARKPSVNRWPTKNGEERPPEAPAVIPLADVEPEPVSWLWEPYIPAGKLTILEGDPGAGKTWVALAICAKLTAEGHNVLYATCEDGLADTIRPRVDSMGADLQRFFILRGKTNGGGETLPFTLADVDVLRRALEAYRPSLLVLDPLQGFLGPEVDMHRANEVRARLAALIRLAEEHKCAVILVRHLTKTPAAKAIYRGLGSIDFTAAARSVLLVGKTQDGQRAVVQTKNSLGPEGAALGFEIRQGEFLWVGEVDVKPGDILEADAPQMEKSALDEAAEWLVELLTEGPLSAKEVFKHARDAGIAEKTLRRAKEQLGVVVTPVKEKGKVTGWLWALPGGQPGGQAIKGNFGHLDKEPANPHEISTFTRWPNENDLAIWQKSSNDAGSGAQKPGGQNCVLKDGHLVGHLAERYDFSVNDLGDEFEDIPF